MPEPPEHPHFDIISEEALRDLLGIRTFVPLSAAALAGSLRVTFFPEGAASARVQAFTAKLRAALLGAGATVVEYDDARDPLRPGKIREHLVIIAPGDLADGRLPVDHVSNLRTVTVVGIVDGPCPADREGGLQEKLNSIVRTLAWNIVQVVVYVDDDAWTIGTMNGAIIRCQNGIRFQEAVFSTLLPKIAAPVVPPHSADFDYREGALDLSSPRFAPYVADFREGGRLWGRTGLLLFHTSLESLAFRNRYYKRVAAAYLDHRSGMSYGFLARQIAVPITPALRLEEVEPPVGSDGLARYGIHRGSGRTLVALRIDGDTFVVEVPAVWMLTTRSGCDKSNIDVRRDLILMGLADGRIVFETPAGLDVRVDCKPSYDTQTIIAHAVGNVLVASVLARLASGNRFPARLAGEGLALAHWHGNVPPGLVPQGYVVHGEANPPVSCSTHQAAVYALAGKLSALRRCLRSGNDFLGDVHLEPHHGTNMTGPSLVGLARWVLDNIGAITEAQSSVVTA